MMKGDPVEKTAQEIIDIFNRKEKSDVCMVTKEKGNERESKEINVLWPVK